MRLLIKSLSLLIVLLALVLTGCGTNSGLKTDPALVPYVEDFQAEAAKRGIKTAAVVAVFDDLRYVVPPVAGKTVLGTCTSGIVRIDRSYWTSLATTDVDREALMYHELGHCALGRGHVEGWTAHTHPHLNGIVVRIPLSVMRAEFIGGYAWFIARDYYINELFTNR
jgi:predicted small secreted protein